MVKDNRQELELLKRVLCLELEESDPRFQEWLHGSSTRLLLFLELKGDVECPVQEQFDKEGAFRRIASELGLKQRRFSGRRKPSVTWLVPGLVAALTVLTVWLLRLDIHPATETMAQKQTTHFEPGGKVAYLRVSETEDPILLSSSFVKMNVDGSLVKNGEDGVVVYSSGDCSDAVLTQMQNLSVPRGGEYSVILSDGTRICLNSESSLSFPSRFNSKERRVRLSGEGFFEVSSSEIPFIVETDEMDVEVQGTVFNINSYPDASRRSATLVSGSVIIRVTDSNQGIKLEPSDHLVLNSESHAVSVTKVDTDIYTSWVQGVFRFRGQRLEDIFLALSRWYNFNVEFKRAEIKDMHFTGSAEKGRDIDFLLNLICSVSDIRYVRNDDSIVLY